MSSIANLYADLSGYYDQFCAEIDYAEQCAFTRRVFATFAGSGGRDYLDLACGTGAHLLHMEPHDFTLTGLDNAADMLTQAATKVPSATLLLADMASLDRSEAFDLITCFLYSIHYNHPTSALEETLARAWQALKPGGVFIFNAVDAAGVRHNHQVSTTLQDGDATLRFESGWQYSGAGEILELHLSITRESALGIQRWEDQHRMTAIPFDRLLARLSALGFEVTVLEHDYSTMRAWDEKSFNIIVVATKPDMLPRLCQVTLR